MSDGMNIDGFKLSGDGISLSDFTAKVNKDNELINIYKAFDKNGDNNLSRDELAGLLGAYKMIDSNGDGTLSKKERKTFDAQIASGLSNDENYTNDGLKIKSRKLNDFFANLMTFIDPNSSKSGDLYTYNQHGQITGGKDTDGDTWTRTYNQDGSYVNKYQSYKGDKSIPFERYYNADGKCIGGRDPAGEFTREYTDNGYTDTYSDRILNYNADGKCIGGTDSRGEFTREYTNEGYTDTYSDITRYYNANGKCIGGITVDGDTWTRTYNQDGSYVNKYQSYKGDQSIPFERYYNANGKCIGGRDPVGEFTRVYNDNGYTDTYGENDIRKYDNSGTVVGGTDPAGEFTREYTDNGYTDTYMDRTRYYDKDGKLIGGIDTNGYTWTRTYKKDGSYTEKYDAIDGNTNNKEENSYNAVGKEIGGKISNDSPLDTEYTVKYDEQGNATYTEYTKSDGTKYFYYNDDNAEQKYASTDVDANGNITTSAIEGESFEDTMNRLGIAEEDIDAFKQANPRAASKGWFIAGAQDVIIPASIASKLDYANMMVAADEQAEAYRRRISGS